MEAFTDEVIPSEAVTEPCGHCLQFASGSNRNIASTWHIVAFRTRFVLFLVKCIKYYQTGQIMVGPCTDFHQIGTLDAEWIRNDISALVLLPILIYRFCRYWPVSVLQWYSRLSLYIRLIREVILVSIIGFPDCNLCSFYFVLNAWECFFKIPSFVQNNWLDKFNRWSHCYIDIDNWTH